MTSPSSILDLVERFDRNRQAYRSGHYNETQVRREFIDPFFEALGWDVANKPPSTNACGTTNTPMLRAGIRGAAGIRGWPKCRASSSVAIGTTCRRVLDLHKRPAAETVPHVKTAPQRQIEATDKQIDALVYELHGLTDDEIKIVEEGASKG